MKLLSNYVQNGEDLPIQYTCDGKGITPELTWSNFPDSTKSFALVCDDPDAVGGKTFIHWIIVNIPITIQSIAEGAITLSIGQSIINDGGKNEYIPPCPPNGSHRYIFKIFALNIEKLDNVSKDNFYDKIKPFVVDQAELLTKYRR